MATTTKFQIRNKENRQVILYASADKASASAFPMPPRAVITVDLTEDQIAYVRQEYGTTVQIS